MSSKYIVAFLCVALSFQLIACLPAAPEPTPTLPPSSTPEPTLTLPPTSTSEPTPTTEPTPAQVLKTSEEFVTAAWEAYDTNGFDAAIELAQECVSRWESNAIQQQSELTEAPPTGEVSDEEKQIIAANWALNDVGTAYFIIGASLQKQGKTDQAKEAYKKVQSFPYARTWDPRGWFWSPEEEATKRLAQIP